MGKKEFVEYVMRKKEKKVRWISLYNLGFENYSISSEGQIKNNTTNKIKKLKDGRGVVLYKNYQRHYFTLKKLMKMYFGKEYIYE